MHMKKRTRRLIGWITIFCIVGILVGAMSLPKVAHGDPGGVGGVVVGVLAIILLASAQDMKNGSRLGWWVLVVVFGMHAIGTPITIATRITLETGWRVSIGGESIIPFVCAVILIYGLFGILPFVLLATDPPWKWRGTKEGPGTMNTSEPGSTDS